MSWICGIVGGSLKNLYELTPFWPLTFREPQIGGTKRLRVLPDVQFDKFAWLAGGEPGHRTFPVTSMHEATPGGGPEQTWKTQR